MNWLQFDWKKLQFELCHYDKKNFTFRRPSHNSYHAEFIPIDTKRKVPNPAGAKLSSVRFYEVEFDLGSGS